MGEGRGKLEALIVELESKQDEIKQMLKEYEVLLPHLQSGLQALDDAGFMDTIAVEIPQPLKAATPAGPKPVPEEVPPIEEAAPPEPEDKEDKAAKKKTAKKKKAAEPARRSIASLVGDDPGESQQAMSASGDDVH